MGVLRAIGVTLVSSLLTLGILGTDAIFLVRRAGPLRRNPLLAGSGLLDPLSLALPGFVGVMILVLYLLTRSVRIVVRGVGMGLFAVGIPPVALEILAASLGPGRPGHHLISEGPRQLRNLLLVVNELPPAIAEPLATQSWLLTGGGMVLLGIWAGLTLVAARNPDSGNATGGS